MISGIVVDTSALVAIFKSEHGCETLEQALGEAHTVIVPVSCLVEAALLNRIEGGLFPWIMHAVRNDQFELAEITREIATLTSEAAQTYGKGSGHPAQLNFGDCMSYAVAMDRRVPLLFVGNDFSHTPVVNALARKD